MTDHGRIGSYEILERLGRGGMGVVYLARHVTSRERVALKTVSVADASMLESIRREVKALAALRHPGIVRILDQGVEEGTPWYAMELLPGRPLHEVIRGASVAAEAPDGDGRTDRLPTGAPDDGRAPTQPLRRDAVPPRAGTGGGAASAIVPLGEALTLVRRLCEPLAYIHGEGLVHRDLKPANVLLDPAGWPVLVDFGIALQSAGISRDALEVEGEAVGTIDYIAPEQAMGELVDARADLYALGAMLYELLVGAPPFAGGTPAEALARRFHDAAEPPSRRNPAIPPELDALTLRLLARDPRERIGYATDVARALARLGGTSDPERLPRPRAYIYRGRLAGRGRELDLLQPRVEALAGGRGGLLLIKGESGVGKTRLASALAGRASAMGCQVLVGACGPSVGTAAAPPLHGLSRPLRAVADLCRMGGPERTARLAGARARVLAVHEPSFRSLPGCEATEPDDLPPAEARLRLWDSLAATFVALGRERPLLLLIDDLQWADELTIGFLELLAKSRRLDDAPLLLAGTCRSDDAPDELAALLASPDALAIARLSEEAVAQLVGDMLALSPPPAPLVAQLTRHAEGNAFFLSEYLHAALADGVLRRDDDGRWHLPSDAAADGPLSLPSSISELVARKLHRLDALSRELVAAAAVLGREVDAALLARIAGHELERTRDGVATLLARQVLEDTGGSSLRFTHEHLRQTAYAAVASEQRTALHGRAADALGALPGAELTRRLGELGRHQEMAGRRNEAMESYLEGARQLVREHAPHQAVGLYRAHLELAGASPSLLVRDEMVRQAMFPAGLLREGREVAVENVAAARGAEGAELGAFLLTQATLTARLGRSAEAIAEVEDALREARARGDRATALGALTLAAKQHRKQGNPGAAEAAAAEALALAEDGDDDRALADALLALGNIRCERCDYEAARGIYERALVAAARSGGTSTEVAALLSMSALEGLSGKPRAALPLLERALSLQRESGDRTREAPMLEHLGLAHVSLGDTAAGEPLLEEALAVARQIGDRYMEGNITANLGSVANMRGDRDLAILRMRAAIPLLEATGNQRTIGSTLTNLALTLNNGGEAIQLLERAIVLQRQTHDRRFQGYALLHLAGMLWRAGRAAEASQAIEEARPIVEGSDDQESLALLASLTAAGAGDHRGAGG